MIILRTIPKLTFAIFFLSFSVSCTTSLSYNSQYEGTIGSLSGSQLSGRAAILTTEADENYIYSGSPTSFTGGGSKISIPLGFITKQIAENVFERMFVDGVVPIKDSANAQEYRIVIIPKIRNFSYAYNQLKNVGMLVTPQVDLSISVDVMNTQGSVIRSNTFVSGTKDGDSYFMSGNPGERINKLVHETITELLNQSASDVYFLVSNENS